MRIVHKCVKWGLGRSGVRNILCIDHGVQVLGGMTCVFGKAVVNPTADSIVHAIQYGSACVSDGPVTRPRVSCCVISYA